MAGSNVWIKSGTVRNLLNDVTPPTGVVTGNWVYKDSPHTTFQATVTGSGTVGATITIQVSNDGLNAVGTAAGTITLSGTTTASDGFATSNVPWKYVRAVVSAPSGTITAISCVMGV